MNTPTDPPTEPLDDQPLRPHAYDGIREYDNKLPNWWLWTLWLAVLFALAYWSVGHWFGAMGDPGERLEARMEENTRIAEASAGPVSDEQMWAMSKDPAAVNAGMAVFLSTCASCHKPDLSGQIGPNLKDNVWIHGAKPNDVLKTITEGVPAKGMLAWGPVLGRTKITQVAAFILSHHDPSETPVVGTSAAATPAPPQPAATPPAAPAPPQ